MLPEDASSLSSCRDGTSADSKQGLRQLPCDNLLPVKPAPPKESSGFRRPRVVKDSKGTRESTEGRLESPPRSPLGALQSPLSQTQEVAQDPPPVRLDSEDTEPPEQSHATGKEHTSSDLGTASREHLPPRIQPAMSSTSDCSLEGVQPAMPPKAAVRGSQMSSELRNVSLAVREPSRSLSLSSGWSSTASEEGFITKKAPSKEPSGLGLLEDLGDLSMLLEEVESSRESPRLNLRLHPVHMKDGGHAPLLLEASAAGSEALDSLMKGKPIDVGSALLLEVVECEIRIAEDKSLGLPGCQVAGLCQGSSCSGEVIELLVLIPRQSPQAGITQIEGWVVVCPAGALLDCLRVFGASGAVLGSLEAFYLFDLEKELGSGRYGSVVVAQEKSGEQRAAAVKMFFSTSTADDIIRETALLARAQGHRSIIGLHGIFRTAEGKWALVLDLHGKGDLYEHVSQSENAGLTEAQALGLCSGILQGLNHIGAKNIFHRDIKPENILVAAAQGGVLNSVITDFGIAVHTSDVGEMSKRRGSIGYASPEMLEGKCSGCEGDAFGAGVVLYFMLSKSTPFLSSTTRGIARRTMECKVSLSYDCFRQVSSHCRQLIRGLIQKSLQERLTPLQALRHRAFTNAIQAEKADVRSSPALQPSLPPEPAPAASSPRRRRPEGLQNADSSQKVVRAWAEE